MTSCKLEGRSDPPAEIKTKFMEQLTSKPGNEGLKNRTVCQLGQDTKAESVQSCQEGDQGWCYLTGEAAGRCAQQIVFNDRVLALAKGSTVFLQCINQTGGGTPNSEAETEE